MKVTNITDKTTKPTVVSIMVRVKKEDKRFELNPGEFIYSNGEFSALFNKSLRVQKQKGLIDVIDENDLLQMEREEQEERELKEKEELIRQQEEEEKLMAEKLTGNAFDNPFIMEEPTRPHHPDVIILNTKKEVDYSSNIIKESEEDKPKKKRNPFAKKDKK